jgi:hypothetical protein
MTAKIISIIADIHPRDARRKAAVRARGDALEKRRALMTEWAAPRSFLPCWQRNQYERDHGQNFTARDEQGDSGA